MSRIRIAIGAAATSLAIARAVPAAAQACVQVGVDTIRCRVLVVSPETLDVLTRAYFRPSGAAYTAELSIKVDGQPCFHREERPGLLHGPVLGSCRVAVGASNHVIEAHVSADRATPAGLGVRLQTAGALSAIPEWNPLRGR